MEKFILPAPASAAAARPDPRGRGHPWGGAAGPATDVPRAPAASPRHHQRQWRARHAQLEAQAAVRRARHAAVHAAAAISGVWTAERLTAGIDDRPTPASEAEQRGSRDRPALTSCT